MDNITHPECLLYAPAACDSCPLLPYMSREFADNIVHDGFVYLGGVPKADPNNPSDTYDIAESNLYENIGISSDEAGKQGTPDNNFAKAIIACFNEKQLY